MLEEGRSRIEQEKLFFRHDIMMHFLKMIAYWFL